MTQPNVIKYQDISGVGLFFARKEDPVNLFALQITKQLYSLIGFYYESKVTGKKRIHIILSDICGIVSSQWMNTFTIENLIHDPLITKLSIRKLSPILNEDGLIDEELTQKRDADFKAAIAEVTSQGPVNSTEDWIKQIIGYEISQPGRGSTTVELVNKVIMRTGNWEKIKLAARIAPGSMEGIIKNKLPKVVPKNSAGKNYIFSRLASDLKQIQTYQPNVSNLLMQSYLVENGIFEPIQHLQLPKHTAIEISLRREQSIAESKNFLADAVSTFVRLLLENKKFFDTVVDAINANTNFKQKQKDTKFKASFINLAHSSNRLVGIIVSMIEKGRFSFELLKHEIDKYNLKLEQTTGSIGIKSNLFPRMDSKNVDRIIIMKNKTGNSKFDLDLKTIHHNLQRSTNNIKNEETAILNINEMIQAVNSIIECSNSNLKPLKEITTKKSYGAVLTTQKGRSIPIQFTDGSQMILPTVGYDLKPYDCEHLKELLQALDIMTDGSDDFDQLRSDIARKYAQCKDNSCKHH